MLWFNKLNCFALFSFVRNVERSFTNSFFYCFLVPFCSSFSLRRKSKQRASASFFISWHESEFVPVAATAAVGNKTLPSSGATLEEPLKIATPRHVSTSRLPTVSSSQRTLSAKFAVILVRQQSAKLRPRCFFSYFKREKCSLN